MYRLLATKQTNCQHNEILIASVFFFVLISTKSYTNFLVQSRYFSATPHSLAQYTKYKPMCDNFFCLFACTVHTKRLMEHGFNKKRIVIERAREKSADFRYSYIINLRCIPHIYTYKIFYHGFYHKNTRRFSSHFHVHLPCSSFASDLFSYSQWVVFFRNENCWCANSFRHSAKKIERDFAYTSSLIEYSIRFHSIRNDHVFFRNIHNNEPYTSFHHSILLSLSLSRSHCMYSWNIPWNLSIS